MPDQTSPSPFWTKPPERAGQHRGDQSLHRAVGAAIVAGALASSGALYVQSPPLEAFPPKHALPDFLPDFANLREFPFLADKFLDHELTGVITGELPGLVELREFLNHEFADFVDPEFTGVPTDESPALVKSLFVVLGPSGCGKSSFLRAGLIPRLQREDRRFVALGIIRPERNALTGKQGLAAAIHAARRALKLRGEPLGEVKTPA